MRMLVRLEGVYDWLEVDARYLYFVVYHEGPSPCLEDYRHKLGWILRQYKPIFLRMFQGGS